MFEQNCEKIAIWFYEIFSDKPDCACPSR
nr:hypothetical protein [Sicyoidochytrium minutum DNA virus]